MLGSIDQMISLVSFGNDSLLTGYANPEFLNHPEYHFSNKNICITGKRYFDNKTNKYFVIDNPNSWFELLIKEKCKKLRVIFEPINNSTIPSFTRAGYKEGGTWFIKAIYDEYFDLWELISFNEYKFFRTEANFTLPDTKGELETVKTQTIQAVENIVSFAYQIDEKQWPRIQNEFNKILNSTTPNEGYYHKHLIVLKNYSISAQQILFAAASLWCFNGMGSWADIGGFSDKAVNDKYYDVTEKLYQAVCKSIVAAINSF